MKRIFDIFLHSRIILSKHHLSTFKRLRLLFNYYRIVVRRFFSGRFGLGDFKSQSFLGTTLVFNRYFDFYTIFVGVFIYEEYVFITEKEAPRIIDCGSNVGVTLAYFKQLYPKAEINLFEPLPENIQYLKQNIENNNFTKVILNPVAVGGMKGTLTLYGKQQAGSLHPEKVNVQSNIFKDHISEVQVVRLSEYIGDQVVDFLKIDIEGAEDDVIQDLVDTNTLRQVRQLVLEYHFFSFKENALSNILSNLEKAGFQTLVTSKIHNLRDFPSQSYHTMLIFAKQAIT